MRWLNDELAKRPFIAGDHYTIADITAQCACVLGKHTGTPIPAELAYLTQWVPLRLQATDRPRLNMILRCKIPPAWAAHRLGRVEA
jgi:glutathione S-transferase